VIVDGPSSPTAIGLLPANSAGDLALFAWLFWRLLAVLVLFLGLLTALSVAYLRLIAPRMQARNRKRP
jgi:hypothetical protein